MVFDVIFAVLIYLGNIRNGGWRVSFQIGRNAKFVCFVCINPVWVACICTNWQTIGVSIETVCITLGHKDLKTTMIYAKILDEVKIKEMQKWNDI
jgi:integrase/recombinase XerC